MKYEIYIKVLLLAMLVFWVGCKKKHAEPYDMQHCDAMLETLEAIEHNDNTAALQAAKGLQNKSFAEEVVLFIKYRQQADTVRDYLKRGDFQALRAYINEKQKNGEASDDLLALSTFPDDLQALALFCSRMPWESSSELDAALKELKDHTFLFSKYQSFQDFLKKQQDTLQKLKQNEGRQKIISGLSELDYAIVYRDEKKSLAAQNQLARHKIKYQEYRISMLNGQNKSLKHADLYAIALADVWPRLSTYQQKRLTKQMPASNTLCYRLVKTMNSSKNTQYVELLMEFRRRKLEPPTYLVVQYMRTLPPLRVKSSTPLPGFHLVY